MHCDLAASTLEPVSKCNRDFLCGVISCAGDSASVCFLATWTGI